MHEIGGHTTRIDITTRGVSDTTETKKTEVMSKALKSAMDSTISFGKDSLKYIPKPTISLTWGGAKTFLVATNPPLAAGLIAGGIVKTLGEKSKNLFKSSKTTLEDKEIQGNPLINKTEIEELVDMNQIVFETNAIIVEENIDKIDILKALVDDNESANETDSKELSKLREKSIDALENMIISDKSSISLLERTLKENPDDPILQEQFEKLTFRFEETGKYLLELKTDKILSTYDDASNAYSNIAANNLDKMKNAANAEEFNTSKNECLECLQNIIKSYTQARNELKELQKSDPQNQDVNEALNKLNEHSRGIGQDIVGILNMKYSE